MVNGLSKVPYKVNVDTLEYLQKGFEQKILLDSVLYKH